MTDQPVSQEARDAAWVLGLFHSTEDAVQAFHRFESLIRADQIERDARVAEPTEIAENPDHFQVGYNVGREEAAQLIRNQEPST